ncbi:MAG: hypothetical protein NC231_03920 [Bacillus sp. (in: Bacteria)]|nr:hypothetical protein [Bacillus sp. (in: firmicutes)]MCM1424980.1 hypothetical protein [Eubacterium sp.]
MKKRKITVGIVMTLCFLILTGCGTKKIDVMESVTLTYNGVNGYGTADIENAYDWEKEALEQAGVKEIENFSSLGDALMIEMSVSYTVSPNENLSNGDEVTVTAVVDNEAVKEYGIKFVAEEKKFKVEGLPEVQYVDLFENIDVSYTGIAPNVTAHIADANTDTYVQGIRYVLDKTDNLNIGDKVTVTAEYDKSKLLEKGYMAESDTKEFEVSNVAKYVVELSEIPDSVLESMKSQMEDAMKAHVASKWDEIESMKDMEYVGSYLLTAKDSMQMYNEHNMIYLIYKIEVDNSENNFFFYSYCRYNDLIILEDGTCSVDISNYRMPQGSSFFGNVSGEAFNKGKYYYLGYEKIDSLFNNCVTANIEYYNYESTVEEK